MKQLLLLIILLSSLVSFGQVEKVSQIEIKPAKGTVEKKPNKPSFSKIEDGNWYYVKDSVDIKNGHGEMVKVSATIKVPKDIWEGYVRPKESESLAVDIILNLLSWEAKDQLKNSLSFEPLKEQFIIYEDGYWRCGYKLMGRNGYGNMVEDIFMVRYKL